MNNLVGNHIVSFSRYLLYWVLIIGISMLCYKYFEIPGLKLRDIKNINNSCE